MQRTPLISARAGCLVAIFLATTTLAREIHVSKMGSESAAGSVDQPLLTIQRAAQLAEPGDTVVVHGGTYREWVKPARGGTGEDARITYRAAPGEEVVIKGSERITSWTRLGGSTR